jgi:hypothetical protein
MNHSDMKMSHRRCRGGLLSLLRTLTQVGHLVASKGEGSGAGAVGGPSLRESGEAGIEEPEVGAPMISMPCSFRRGAYPHHFKVVVASLCTWSVLQSRST